MEEEAWRTRSERDAGERAGDHRGVAAGRGVAWMRLPVLKFLLAVIDVAVLGLVRRCHCFGQYLVAFIKYQVYTR